ncbi:MCE family protein [Actinocorallia libanotica]|uniref:MCE family protein n=1 Tax=Actinocorallia libanotica TaxID=46162 RepID=UPI0031D20800
MRRAVIVVTAVALTSGACSVQTLGAPKGDFVLYAVFDDVQNLVAGHSVQISDVPVGSVAGIRLEGYRVRVTMSIVDGTRIPAGTTATLAKASLLGENLVRLDPPAEAGPRFLPSGATLAQTSVQPGLEQVSERVAPVVAALGGQDLNEIITGLSTGLEGQGPALNKIIKRANEISDSYAAANRDLADVIDGMGRLGRSLAESAPALDRLPGLLVETTERVQKDRKELKRAVKDLTAMASAVNDKVGTEHGERLRRLLLRLDAVLGKMIKGKDQLKAFARSILDGFAKAPSMTNEGQALIHVWLNGFLPAAPAREKTDIADTLKELTKPR